MARKANDPKASNWDRLSSREDKDTLQYRDVFEDQQLDRSKIDGVRKRTARLVLTWVVAAVVALIAWAVLAGVAMAGAAFTGLVGGGGDGQGGGDTGSFYVMTDKPGSNTLKQFCVLDGPGGSPTAECYPDEVAVQDAKPQWYLDAQSAPPAQDGGEDGAAAPADEGQRNYAQELMHFEWWKLIVSMLAGLGVAGVIYPILIRNLDAQNLMNDTSDINQYTGDQHIALPDEVMRKFDWFPDVGAHSNVQPSSMISHVMLTNKGLKKVQVSRRADKDILDEDGDVEYLKGEILRDGDGEALSRTVPIIDESFGDALFDASNMPKDKRMRRKYDTSSIEYNADGSNRDKLGKFKTVADLINEDWIVPEYEVQLPGGAYIVDTAPVNTMVLAITRAGKGQTYIEPMIDMWLRERRPNNMVINDPKGELLVKHYVRATMRGYQVVQFNLINAMKTDIYNPLGMAAESAREGDVTKTAMYVENIADVFFPLDGGEDPVWPAAANNAFKRAAYGLIDFYLEEERALRATAARTDMDPKVLDQRLDAIWGKVTLYNCYQLFVQLSSKKQKNPVKEVEAQAKAGAFGNPQDPEAFDDDAYLEAKEEAQARSFLWEDKDELDLLTLYFNATQAMPRNSMRTLVANADNALRAMGAAEKMLASVYGIAITAMSFFTDPTISTLTSGTPSQNTDLGGLSFPRRMGVRFGMNYLKRDHLIGAQAKWDAFGDPMFTEPLGKDFDHEDIVSREGWAKYYFIGKFEKDVAYLRLRLLNPQTGVLIRTFYFRFTKDYQLSLNGRMFVKDPITGRKIVKNGILVELKPVVDEEATAAKQREADARAAGEAPSQAPAAPAAAPSFGGKKSPFATSLSELGARKAAPRAAQVEPVVKAYVPGHTEYPHTRLTNIDMALPEKEVGSARAIISDTVRYSEQPKAVFLVTPPHLMKYAKLILILVKQLVDLNFDKSYMTKSNQKPLYKTRFMLDELGNLQSEGHGISGFETMLSIGLGQEQQFTLILQTLQQLRDVYGESVDKIVQGNAAPLHTLIATPNGWQTMGETKVGDVILTPFGDRTAVTGVFPKGTRPVYRVTLRDGSSSEVCEQHLWQVERWKSAIRYLGGKGPDGKRLYEGSGPGGATSVRVSEVIDTLALKARVDAKKPVDLPRLAPLDYDAREFPVDPYVLGVILGDGNINPDQGFVTMSKNDDFVIEELRRRGADVGDYGVRPDGTHRYGIRGMGPHMRDLGLAGKRAWEKSIPEEYLYGSIEQRLDLLRGLMDTDGTISAKGEMEFTSSSQALAEGVQALIRSLGGRVAINVKTNVMFTSPNQATPKQGRDAYRVQNIRLQKLNPFLLPRKAERWVERDDNSGNRVVSVEYVRDEPVQCISVADERHLYVMNDYMPTHNTSNIVYLKSTDDSMIETLSKMSGTRHVTYRDSKSVTKDTERLIKGLNVEGKVTYTMNTKEEAVISYNDMAFISEKNSIVFRAGDAPVWNRNETILPMSFRLFKDTIVHPGHDYTLQTIPTLSSALDFDVRMNQPDFEEMLKKRMREAEATVHARALYQQVFEYSDVDIARLDPDVYADEVMELVDQATREMIAQEEGIDPDDADASLDGAPDGFYDDGGRFEDDMEMQREAAAQAARQAELDRKLYAGGTLSRSDLVRQDGTALQGPIDRELVQAYTSVRAAMDRDTQHFSAFAGGVLRSADGSKVYIEPLDESESVAALRAGSTSEDDGVYADDPDSIETLAQLTGYRVDPSFYEFLASLDSWQGIAGGEFERAMARLMSEDLATA